MGAETFEEKLLTEKLSKLNSSQQSIESVSRWCISHRKKAKQVVETWDGLFKSAQQEQRVSFLYLANDILQNSRRKGSEFVNEFWKILPSALKGVYDTNDENCRKAATRLVDIWEERKVFGSRGQNLKNAVLGNNASSADNPKNPSPLFSGKNSNPIKVVKRDANSLRIKLAVGGLPEKILTAFQSVYDEVVNEESALNNCRNAVSCIQEIEIDVVNVSSQGNWLGSDVLDNIQKQENILQQCIGRLENSEANRVTLVSQLREALHDQESKLELTRSELQVARGQIDKAANVKRQLTSPSAPILNQPIFPPGLATNSLTALTPSHPLTSFVNLINEEETKKATAAAVAAKLTASSSSALMFTSVLSSFVAEEVAAKSSGLKRPKLETSTPLPGLHNSDGANSAYFHATQQALPNMQSSGMQSITQLNPLQVPFLPPPPIPTPLAPPDNAPGNQMIQSTIMGMPYNYSASNIHPPHLSSNVAMDYSRPVFPPQHLQNQQAQQQLQPPANGGYFRPSGMGHYGHSRQMSAPQIHKQ